MKMTAIRSDRIYREMMNAAPAEKENIYREKLMKPFEFKCKTDPTGLSETVRQTYSGFIHIPTGRV